VIPDPVLRQKSKKVGGLDSSTQRLIDEMVETMHHDMAVGLAAPQVGVLLRVIVIGLPEEETITLINPEVVKRRGERIVEEGCLSIPGYQGEVIRSVSVTVKGFDRKGREVRLKGKELLGQALEHEIDHLNGVLYTDHLAGEGKLYKIEPGKGGGM
jgi:peptide deformylase